MLPFAPVFALAGAAFQTPPRPMTLDELSRIQAPKREIRSVLLVTGDVALVKRLRKDLRFASQADVERAFPASRFEIVPWDAPRRIVIDRATGPLGRIGDPTVLDGGFLRQIAKRGVMDVAAMTPEEYGAAKSMFVKWPGAGDRQSIEPVALGLGVDNEVRLHAGPVTRSFYVGLIDPRKEPMAAALRDRFLNGGPAVRNGLSPADRAVEPLPKNEIALASFGEELHDVESLRLVYEALRNIGARMRREAADANQRLLKELGYALTPDSETVGSMDGMPKRLRTELEQILKGSWSRLGFNSQAAALDFLQSADSFESWTTLSLREMVSPGDPSVMGAPSINVEHQFARVPGVYLP